MPSFTDKLRSITKANASHLCIGLDPDPSLIPISDIVEFTTAIIESTADLVCAYKPNLAFYEQLGSQGYIALEKAMERIPSAIPTIGDAKRGDIDSASTAYARALFGTWGFDAVTVNPLLGRDSIEPFLEYTDRTTFALCRTSNPGAKDFQDVTCSADGRDAVPLFMHIAREVMEWGRHGNIGLVMGATAPDEIRMIRDTFETAPLLIPGVGAQGGDLRCAVQCAAPRADSPFIISVSRHVLYAADNQAPYQDAARKVAEELRRGINETIDGAGTVAPASV